MITGTKVSFIVPVYNMEKTVEKCITSIEHQTYEDIEIVVIDDGSTDGSREIIEELAKNDSRVLFISRPNKGVSLTLEEGIKVSSGTWLMFVDSDDYIDIDLTEKLMTHQKEHDADVVQTSIKYVDINGKTIKTSNSINRVICNKNELLKAYFIECSINSSFAATLINKELFEEGKFHAGAISMDLQVMPYVYANCKTFVQITDPFYNAVQFSNSVSRGIVTDAMFDDKFLCNEVLERFFETHAPELKDYIYYRKAGVASNLYMKIRFENCKVSRKQEKLEKCINEFKSNYPAYKRSTLLEQLPKKNRYRMQLFDLNPRFLYMLINIYNRIIMPKQ